MRSLTKMEASQISGGETSFLNYIGTPYAAYLGWTRGSLWCTGGTYYNIPFGSIAAGAATAFVAATLAHTLIGLTDAYVFSYTDKALGL